MLLTIKLRGVDTVVKLHHLPYTPDDNEADSRYLEKRPKDEGHLLLHGHCHNAWLCIPKKRMFNVGVDRSNEYRPWSIREIEEELERSGYFEDNSTSNSNPKKE